MVRVTAECIVNRACNIISSVTPLSLNPPALKEKRLNELTELLATSMVKHHKRVLKEPGVLKCCFIIKAGPTSIGL